MAQHPSPALVATSIVGMPSEKKLPTTPRAVSDEIFEQNQDDVRRYRADRHEKWIAKFTNAMSHSPCAPQPEVRFVVLLQEAWRHETAIVDRAIAALEAGHSSVPTHFRCPTVPLFPPSEAENASEDDEDSILVALHSLRKRREAIAIVYRNLIADVRNKLRVHSATSPAQQHAMVSEGIGCFSSFLPWSHTMTATDISAGIEDHAMLCDEVSVQMHIGLCRNKLASINARRAQLLRQRMEEDAMIKAAEEQQQGSKKASDAAAAVAIAVETLHVQAEVVEEADAAVEEAEAEGAPPVADAQPAATGATAGVGIIEFKEPPASEQSSTDEEDDDAIPQTPLQTTTTSSPRVHRQRSVVFAASSSPASSPRGAVALTTSPGGVGMSSPSRRHSSRRHRRSQQKKTKYGTAATGSGLVAAAVAADGGFVATGVSGNPFGAVGCRMQDHILAAANAGTQAGSHRRLHPRQGQRACF